MVERVAQFVGELCEKAGRDEGRRGGVDTGLALPSVSKTSVCVTGDGCE